MSELAEIRVPLDQQEGTESVVGTWLKKVGDSVRANEPILELSTDKVSVEIFSPADGELVEILKDADAPVKPGDLLGRVRSGASASYSLRTKTSGTLSPENSAAISQNDSTATPATITQLTPAVKRLLKEHNLAPEQITGTGREGRITVEDIERHLDGGSNKSKPVTPSPTSAGSNTKISGKIIPHTQMRKKIAQHMVESVTIAPHVTSLFEVDLGAVIADREKRKVDFEGRGVKLTLSAYFALATSRALLAVPEVNSRWHDHGIELFDFVNLGIAVATDDAGLIVPVIHGAEKLDLFGTAQELQRITELARTEKLQPRDVQGGTFTISNHGMSGSLLAAPIIINQPQSAILGIGKLEKRPKVVTVAGKDQLEIRPLCYITLTLDHRILDGFKANAFLSRVCSELESFK